MTKRTFWTGKEISPPKKGIHDNCIFCFGSNPEGRHGLGLARHALDHWGAIRFQGRGRQGKSYAIVTKNLKPNYFEKATGLTYAKYGRRSVPYEWIKQNIWELYDYASAHPHLKFIIPYVLGNGNLNGYSSKTLMSLFLKDISVPTNIVFHESWKKYINN